MDAEALHVQGDPIFFDSFGGITISFEPCRNETHHDVVCKAPEKIEEVRKQTYLWLQFDHQQVVMKDQDSPIQTIRRPIYATHQKVTIELAPNEFTDNQDRVGLFSQRDAEPFKFLSIEAIKSENILN